MPEPRRRRRKETASPSTQQPQSSWPNLYAHRDKASLLVGTEQWALFQMDLLSHRRVHSERLINADDNVLADKLRGTIKAIDFILSLPEIIENWKKQQ